ncbi:hypothetical protein [Pseudoxanthomonas sacheonensis]|uniref:Uncharacterized protein n=1 Tax=Pseudoxanthomonas sacheonensis TaxID=443615 RepID=A0ABU1RQS6_9GAMM|nr:hypothetical protein [Pseudoxanthomonas sacheonensis]MDR6841126.1 hypothetical protein [Pseudoxanthomonas sacheonensis]
MNVPVSGLPTILLDSYAMDSIYYGYQVRGRVRHSSPRRQLRLSS